MKNIEKNTKDLPFLKGILENDYAVLDEIYRSCLPRITAMVKKNSGTDTDAKDVFQEAIVVLYKKAKDPDFKLTTSFTNYIYGVSRFVWLRQLKKNQRYGVTLDDEERYVGEDDIESDIIENEKKALFKQYFVQLGVECREVLQLFFDGQTMKEIAINMNYAEQYAKRKKYKCKKQLLKMIQNDNRFNELK